MRLSARLFASFLAPGLVLLLVAVQVRFGMLGFDQHHGGLLGILEIPGMLLGWGSIAFLLPLLVWLVLDWWGYHAPALVLKLLGALALGLAVSGMAGIIGGVPAAGQVGAGMAELFAGSLGEVAAMFILTALALPGVLLAGAGFRPGRLQERTSQQPVASAATRVATSTPIASPTAIATPAARATPTATRNPTPSGSQTHTGSQTQTGTSGSSARGQQGEAEKDPLWKRAGDGIVGLFKPRKRYSNLADLVRGEEERAPSNGEAWYPDRQFDDAGNELPMQFGKARDVGEIRYADEDPEEAREIEALADGALPDGAAPPRGAGEGSEDPQGGDEDANPNTNPTTNPTTSPTTNPTGSDAAGGSSAVRAGSAPALDEPTNDERLPTIAEVLRGDIDTSILSATGALDSSVDDSDDETEDEDDGPVHVPSPEPFGAGVTLAAPFPTLGSDTDDEDDDDAALPPGVRYADPQPRHDAPRGHPQRASQRRAAQDRAAGSNPHPNGARHRAGTHDDGGRLPTGGGSHRSDRGPAERAASHRPRVSGSPYAEVADSRHEVRPSPTRPRPDASRDPVAEALRSDARREAETVEQAVSDVGALMRGPSADIERAPTRPTSIRENVLKAFRGEHSENANQRYMEKLEASGIFDFGTAAPEQTDAGSAKGTESAEDAEAAHAPSKAKAKRASAPRKRTASKTARATRQASPKARAEKKGAQKQPSRKKAAGKKTAPRKQTGNAKGSRSDARSPESEGPSSNSRTPESRRDHPGRDDGKSDGSKGKRTGDTGGTTVEAPATPEAPQRKRDTGRRTGGSPSDWRRGPNGPSPSVDESGAAQSKPASGEGRAGGDRAASLLTPAVARRLRAELAADPLFAHAARIAAERGAASPVLFLRRLGVNTPQARDLVTRLITTGVLDARSPSGAHPTRIPLDVLEEIAPR